MVASTSASMPERRPPMRASPESLSKMRLYWGASVASVMRGPVISKKAAARINGPPDFPVIQSEVDGRV